jgi:membrane protease YdiL (CAAX protease family)
MTAPWRAVGLFLLLTICLSGIFWALINATQTVNAAYIFGLMWMPAVAAILTCRILGRPLRTLGLATWNGRYVLIGYLILIAYCLVASLGIWIFGFGGFPNSDFVQTTAEAFGLGRAPDWVVIALFVVLTGTTGMVSGVAAATGEEIGWRGFLVPELAKVLPFTGVALVSGLIWVVALPDHRRRLPGRRPSAVVLAVDIHIRRDRDQLRAGVAAVGDRQRLAADFPHASHNLWMQSIFSPLTSDREFTKWVAGDLGLAFVVVAAVVAAAFWLKRGALPTKPVVPQPV